MAHLLDHVQFKGTATRHDIPVELDKHGARWNASTWLDRTNYFETMTSSDGNLGWALGVEADRMTNSLIAEKDRSSEMTVVRNELEAGENDPFSISARAKDSSGVWETYAICAPENASRLSRAFDEEIARVELHESARGRLRQGEGEGDDSMIPSGS